MGTITLSKTEYETLKKKASLYEEIFKYSPRKFPDTESYSKKRVKEFLKEDRLNPKTRNQLEKLLKSV